MADNRVYPQLSLAERFGITGNRKSGRIGQEKGKIPAHAFWERVRRVQDGEQCDSIDMNPLMEQLKVSAALPLSQICSEEVLSELSERFWQSSGELIDGVRPKEDYGDCVDDTVPFPTTYGEGARLVRNAWKNRESSGRQFDLRCICDRAWVIMKFYMEIAINEIARRCGQKDRMFPGYYDISDIFPAMTIPLPLYFRAAAGRCSQKDQEKELSEIYSWKFGPLLSGNPQLAQFAKSQLDVQPDRSTFYCDPVNMVNVVLKAKKDSILTEDVYAELMYDLLIRPYATD